MPEFDSGVEQITKIDKVVDFSLTNTPRWKYVLDKSFPEDRLVPALARNSCFRYDP